MMESITLASGCFWCYESVFRLLKCVANVEVGYAGGTTPNTTYEDVSNQTTKHAESYKIYFDNDQISLAQILDVFWYVHDPITLNRQGADIGNQYRSAIFYTDQDQKEIVEESKDKQQSELADPIVTEISKLDKFYSAEDYHQKFFEKNPQNLYCQVNIPPKIDKIKKKFIDLIK